VEFNDVFDTFSHDSAALAMFAFDGVAKFAQLAARLVAPDERLLRLVECATTLASD